jgi:hypothetical protein
MSAIEAVGTRILTPHGQAVLTKVWDADPWCDQVMYGWRYTDGLHEGVGGAGPRAAFTVIPTLASPGASS